MLKCIELRKICSIETGSRGRGGAESSGIPSIGGEQISSDGYINKNKMKYISQDHYSKMKQGILKENDVLLVKDGATTGKCAFYRGEYDAAAVNEHVFILRANNLILSKLLYYIVISERFQQQIQANIKGIIGGINLSIKQIKIDIPDTIEEQQEIVDILDTMSNIIKLREECISHAQDLIPALFQEMFGDPINNNKNYSCESLKKLCSKIGSGATPRGGKESYLKEGISFVRSMNVHDGIFQYKDLVFINDEQAKLLDNVELQESDVLINITGASVARTCIVPKEILPARVNQHVSILRCTGRLNPYFLNVLLYFQTTKQKLLDLANSKGATREAITKQQLELFKIILPPIEQQELFAEKVQEIEAYIKTQQAELENAKTMFQSLLHHAFTGELTNNKPQGDTLEK